MTGCLLGALLCLLTTAVFALADARVSSAAPAGPASARAEIVVSVGKDRHRTPVSELQRAAADADNPFEEGRLPLASGTVPARAMTWRRPAAAADDALRGRAASPLERPPRA